ncbi:MAG: tetratricopeptide repeat protein [Saprospiraceae bacterium]|nr:tetratricopeptide repeat protein [Saprospiraceae bacterium]
MIFANSKLNKIDKLKFLVSLIGIFVLTSYLFAQQKGIKPAVNGQQSIVNGQQSIVNNQKSIVNNTYAVVVGISDYQDPGIPDLRFADRDAEAFANYLRSDAGGKLDIDHLKVLLNEKATVAQFAIALDWLMEIVKENDQVIIYFSGHGDVEKSTITQPGYLLCWDAPSRVYLAGGALALPMFQDIITTLSAQNKAKVVVITDACRSGKLAGSSVGGSQITGANLAKQYSNEIKILSCQPNEYSIEGEQWGGGRGAFSYHLIDALYGMADSNKDLIVSLQEAGRYIEDHVSSEVAPVSQVPMVLGNRTDALSKVNVEILASLKSGKSSHMSFLSAIDSRGMETDVLAMVDTSIRLTYRLFKQALEDKVFLEPSNACADTYYNQLIQEPKLARLHTTLKRNYAAALQDDAQFILNSLLVKGIDKALTNADNLSLTYFKYPKLLDRAAELLGKDHYFYRSLFARKYFFESYLEKSSELKMEKCRLSLNLLNDFPLAYWRMAYIQGREGKGTCDSAVFYLRKAIAAAPGWVRPYCDLATYNCDLVENRDSLIEIRFSKAYEIDSTSAVLWYTKALVYDQFRKEPDKAIINYEKALSAANTYSLCFPCIYINLGSIYEKKGDTLKAIELYKEGLKTDSINKTLLSALGYAYVNLRKYDSAIIYLKTAVLYHSEFMLARVNITGLYFLQKSYVIGEKECLDALQIDPNEPDILENYADILLATERKESAILNYRKSHIFFVPKSLKKAERILNKLLDLDSLNRETMQLKLDFEEMRKSKSNSIAYGFLKLQYDSTNTKYWNYIGDGYREIKDYNKAIYYYNRSLSLDSIQVKVKINRAFCFEKLNQSDRAIKDLDEVLALDSTEFTALNNLGLIYLNSGSYDRAKPLFLKAINYKPKFANPNKHLGILHYRMGENKLAKQYLFKAIELDTNYILAYLGMSYVLTSEHNFTEALRFVELAIQKKATIEQLEKDENLTALRAKPEWTSLMKKYFAEKIKN